MSRILVIDDDRSVRHLIAKAFEETDVQVVPAATAEEGMHLLGDAQSDVVLLDILLPESSGLELFERIRTVDPKLPVIFITSLSSSDTAIKAMTLGAFDYLLKPLDLGAEWSPDVVLELAVGLHDGVPSVVDGMQYESWISALPPQRGRRGGGRGPGAPRTTATGSRVPGRAGPSRSPASRPAASRRSRA